MYKYTIEELKTKAENIANSVEIPSNILLYGDLGAGKTTFAQFFIKHLLGDNTVVTSPTFNIVQIYNYKKCDIWHVDLYRINNETELDNLGIYEAMTQNICIIEWPEIIANTIQNKIEIFL